MTGPTTPRRLQASRAIGKRRHRVKHDGGSGALHGNEAPTDGGYGRHAPAEQVRHEGVAAASTARSRRAARVLAGERDFPDNPTCKNDGPCLDHGGSDFGGAEPCEPHADGRAAHRLPRRLRRGRGACSIFVCAQPNVCTSPQRHRARSWRDPIDPGGASRGCLTSQLNIVRRWRSCTPKPGTRFRRGDSRRPELGVSVPGLGAWRARSTSPTTQTARRQTAPATPSAAPT